MRSAGTVNWSSQAGRAAFGFQGNLVSAVRTNPTTRFFKSSGREWISFEQDAVARRDCEHVRGHPLEFLVGNLDEFVPVFLEELPERDWKKSRVDHGEVVVQNADERHQVQAVVRAPIVRERDRFYADPDALQRVPQLSKGLSVRAKSLADCEDVVVHP